MSASTLAHNDVTSNPSNEGYVNSGSSPPLAHLRTLFEHVPHGYLCLAFGPDYEHLIHRFIDLSDPNRWKLCQKYLDMSLDTENCFYSGAIYRNPDAGRTKNNILFVTALLLDRDDRERHPSIPPPTATVTTSPGSYQDIFCLDGTCDVATADRLQLAMTALCGCNDVHDAGHLCRLPGSRNFKHDDAPLVTGGRSGGYFHIADFAHLPMPEMPVETSQRPVTARIHKDHRNTTLTSTAGRLQKQGFSDAAIFAASLAENQEKCIPPLPDVEVRGIARSITTRYPKGEPIGKSETVSDLPANGYETFSPAALLNMKTVPFLIDGVIPLHGLVEIVGPSGSFKSFYALHVAADVASRTAQDGAPESEKPKNVLYVAAEGFFGIGQRLAAWQTQYRDIPEERFRLINVAPKLLVAADVDRVIATVRREHSQVIIVDTLARTMGGDENSTKDMTAYTDACGRISAETGALVIVVHHFGWNGERQRGSSVLFAAADAELTVNRSGDDLTVKVTKAKDFQDGGNHHFTAKSVPYVALDGVSTTSLVLVPSDGVKAAFRAMSRYQDLLDCLETFGENGTTSTKWWEKSKMPKTTFDRARRYLSGTKEIVREGSLYKVNRENGTTSTT